MENHDERGVTHFHWQKLRLWRSGDPCRHYARGNPSSKTHHPSEIVKDKKKPLAVPHSVPRQSLNTNKSILTTSRRAVIFVRHRPMCGDYSTLGTDRTARRLFGPGTPFPTSHMFAPASNRTLFFQACGDMWLDHDSRKLYLACLDAHSRPKWFPSVQHFNLGGRKGVGWDRCLGDLLFSFDPFCLSSADSYCALS